MDFPVDPAITEAIRNRCTHEIFGYTFPPESAVQALCRWLEERHGWKVKEKEVFFISGVVPGLFLALESFTSSGDKVCIQTPVYHPFFDVIEKNQRKLVLNPLREGKSGYEMDLDHLEKCLKQGVRLVFLCSPHNPVGRVWRKEELQAFGELCASYGALVVSDEIHCDIVFSGNSHIPYGRISDDFAQNAVVLNAPSKTFNVPGLCTANAIIPNPRLRKQFRAAMNRCTHSMVNIFGPIVLEAAYTHGKKWLDSLLQYLEKNRDEAVEFFHKEIPGVSAVKSEGSYLLWIDFRETGKNPDEIRTILLEHGKLALSDGREFGPGGQGFQRMNIGCPGPVLREAFSRIKKISPFFQ